MQPYRAAVFGVAAYVSASSSYQQWGSSRSDRGFARLVYPWSYLPSEEPTERKRMKSLRPRVSCALIIAILGLYSGARGASLPAKPLTAPSLKCEKYKLANGLEVILHENHRLPLVAVDTWYHVGPRNEKQGATGFAHLFEHMM